MFYSDPEWQSWVLTCWLSSTRTWFIEPSHSLGSPLTSFSLRCRQMQETSSGLAETSSGMVAMSSSTTWTCVGWSGLNCGRSDTEKAHKYSCSKLELLQEWNVYRHEYKHRLKEESAKESTKDKNTQKMASIKTVRDTNESQTSKKLTSHQ